MAPHRRRRVIASRRRREDEGEDGGSAAEETIDDDSLSEGTMSNPDEDPDDGEGSEVSEAPDVPKSNGQVRTGAEDAQPREGKSKSPSKGLFDTTVSDTEAMLNGMKLSEEAENMAEINFDDMKADLDEVEAMAQKPAEEAKTTQKEREREHERERENYVRERGSNPAFVPTRGGFFLHDKRSTEGQTNNHRGNNNRPKSRPHGLIVDSSMGRRSSQKPDVTDGQWEHDLHDSVIHEDRPAAVPPPSAMPNRYAPSPSRGGVPTAPRSSPPNRSFSTTLLVGNVPVVVFLPGMENPIPFSAVPKRQHTRLPQHRPPLRRDKPVRISLPGQPPRYIFPATERSFIFIPRALRPNQQSYRGRGRGGFYGGFGSRRTSAYGGSIYTPSVAMSRRSSFGPASREGFQSPAGSVMSRPGMVPGEGGKPVVRLPPPVRPPVPGLPPVPSNVPPPPMPNLPHPPPYPMPQNPAFRENRPTPGIPMHQPRPQKTVSVADIESPASFPYNAPPQQQEQPFHQQVPPSGQGFMPESGYPPQPGHAPRPSQASAGTPLSQIPERAIHAQPFQPYPYQQPQPYYPPSGYPPGTMFYPPTNAEYGGYNPAVPGGAPPYAPPNQPGAYPMQPQQPSDQPMQPGTVAHESNGTVYFYDTSQFQNTGYPPPPPNSGYPGGVVGMGGMMTPPGATYYYGQPQPQSQNGTVYYQ